MRKQLNMKDFFKDFKNSGGCDYEEITENVYKSLSEKLFDSSAPFSDAAEELERLDGILKSNEQKIRSYNQIKLKLGQLSDLCKKRIELEAKGSPPADAAEMIADYYNTDLQFLEYAEVFYNENLQLRDYMFGYPANMTQDSYTVKYLRELENRIYLMNNCGDPREGGYYYKMDSKNIENIVVDMFAQKIGFSSRSEYWGYITSGGTEGNFFGIRQGFSLLVSDEITSENAPVLYYSKASHYSIPKIATVIKGASVESALNKEAEYVTVFPYREVDTNPDESIDVDSLVSQIQYGWNNGGHPAVILLTWGTTKRGACDDAVTIHKRLDELKIKHYIHLDAAMYGGIPNGQKAAPVLPDFYSLGIDSVSVSLHKYIGSSIVNGIVIASRRPKYGKVVNCQVVDYIGQSDSTILGSRDFSPFSTLQRCREIFERSGPDDYSQNIMFFENELNKTQIWFQRINNANIFILKKPAESICKKYQLSKFADGGNELVHVIIFPYHKKTVMAELVEDLTKSQINGEKINKK